ncbi:hypothetical protein EDC01DRAFT_637817 [Geopyxis carbonaria]|nr:hypothetical protein EDC01DRAFT_637817 [Geopyxis carbonaria]
MAAPTLTLRRTLLSLAARRSATITAGQLRFNSSDSNSPPSGTPPSNTPPSNTPPSNSATPPSGAPRTTGFGSLLATLRAPTSTSSPTTTSSSSSTPPSAGTASPLSMDEILAPTITADDDYHLHVYAHKHNTHITFTRPDRGAIVSLSAGNIGFTKSHRGTYDAAYQLATNVFKKIEELRVAPRSLEVVMRGFGQGREAVMGALLGQEGRYLRDRVTRVTDSTRLKFGGTRSKKPRRLG